MTPLFGERVFTTPDELADLLKRWHENPNLLTSLEHVPLVRRMIPMEEQSPVLTPLGMVLG